MKCSLLLAILLVGHFAHAQTPEDDEASLATARAELEARAEDTSAEGEAWRTSHKERIDLLEELLATTRSRESLPALDEVERRAAELEGELAAARAAELPDAVRLESIDELEDYEQAQRSTEAARVSASTNAEGVVARRGEGEDELDGLSDRGAAASSRAESLTEDDDLSRYRIESARIESRVVSERATFLTAALERWNRQESVLRDELELATLAAGRAQALADLAEVDATRLRELEAEEAREEAASEERRAARERDPIARFRFRTRAEAGNLRAESKSFETTLSELADREERAEEAQRDLAAERLALEERLRLRLRGVETILRRHLDRSRRALRQITDHTLPDLDDGMEANQVAQGEILDRLWDARLPASESAALAELLSEVDSTRHEEVMAAFASSRAEDDLLEALHERSEQLGQATASYARLLEAASKRDSALREFEDFILGQMMWIRSDPPIDGDALVQAWDELASIPEPYRRDQTWSRLRDNVSSRFPILLVAIAAIVLLHFLNRRIAGWRTLGSDRRPRMRHVLRFTGGLIRAACPALQLWIGAWAVFALGGPEQFDPPVTTLLIYHANFLFARRVTRVLLGKDGLLVGPQAFRPDIGLQIVRCVKGLTIAGQACFAPYLVLAGSPFNFVVLPRIFFTAWSLCVALAVLGLLRRKGALVQAWTLETGLLRPVLRFLVVFNTIALLPVFALDILGYRVGAQRALLNGLNVFTAVFLLGALFRLMERIGNYWVERAERAESEEDERLIVARGVGIRALVRVGAYTVVLASAFLLRDTMGIGGALLKLLPEIKLVELEPDRWLTAWNIVVGVFWIAAGHILAANLRALHQSLVAPFAGTTDEGSQYAFLALIRYVVLAVAYGVGLLNVGFSFETLGWFATAASVGLGFGLQEIVANFVSGLILLFERPIRVGDIVTIGATSGKIESISIRATVITNWERQTIIVPNKKFVTEDLTNWTRADKVMRREVRVRVTYGTDVERVLRLLGGLVKEHPAVLTDPSPIVHVDSFGVVGIEFVVFFYTPIALGLNTRSELHSLISERFAAEGIEIPSARSPEDMLGGAPPAP